MCRVTLLLQLYCPDQEGSGGHQHGTAAILVAGIDGCLHCGGVEGRAIALRAKGAHVVDPGSQIDAGMLRAIRLGGEGIFRQKASASHGRHRGHGHSTEPLAPGHQLAVIWHTSIIGQGNYLTVNMISTRVYGLQTSIVNKFWKYIFIYRKLCA